MSAATASAISQADQSATRPVWQAAAEIVLNLIASVHVVWFYLSFVHSYMQLERYEQGTETTPFQHRLLLMLPLRWAHASVWLNHITAWLMTMPAWFPHGVRPEGLVEAPVDLLAVAGAGMAARSLYKAASPTGVLTPLVYPLTLLMILVTYTVSTMHRFRFVYDLPSLGFFAAGCYLLYFRKAWLWFAGLFFLATLNRETTLFLLILYALRETAGPAGWKSLRHWKLWLETVPLLLFWVGWHVWVARHFAANHSEAASRLWLNVGTLLWPFSWVHLLSTFAFCGPLVLLYQYRVRDPLLRRWVWILPIWFIFMMRFGVLVETRIFGELIPYMACMSALIAEDGLLRRLPRYQGNGT